MAPPALDAPPPAAVTGFQPIEAENLLVLDTSKGRVLVELRPDIAPNHVARIRALVRKNYYDADVFSRVLPSYIAQTGENTVGGDPVSCLGTLKAEFGFTPAAPLVPFDAASGFAAQLNPTLLFLIAGGLMLACAVGAAASSRVRALT